MSDSASSVFQLIINYVVTERKFCFSLKLGLNFIDYAKLALQISFPSVS